MNKTSIKRHIPSEELRSALTVGELQLICGTRTSSQTAPFYGSLRMDKVSNVTKGYK